MQCEQVSSQSSVSGSIAGGLCRVVVAAPPDGLDAMQAALPRGWTLTPEIT